MAKKKRISTTGSMSGQGLGTGASKKKTFSKQPGGRKLRKRGK